MKTLVIDVETDGLPPKNADYKTQFQLFPNILSIAFKVDDQETKEYIINQEGRKIPDNISKINGITTEMANASPYFIAPIMAEIIVLDVPEKTIGHNIYFDSSTIKAQVIRLIRANKLERDFYEKLEQILHKERRVDTMKATIKYCDLPGKYGPKWPKLTELHYKLFGCGFEGAHSSGGDVEATYKCYTKLKELGII